MAPIEFPPDFSEFLRLLNDHDVEFMVVGGFAVAIYGYPRATADLDIWIRQRRENAERVVACMREFGFDAPNLTPELFDNPDMLLRMGVAPLRIELLTSIDGVDFEDCAAHVERHLVSGVTVPVISLAHLKINKRASGRAKDLADLDHLP